MIWAIYLYGMADRLVSAMIPFMVVCILAIAVSVIVKHDSYTKPETKTWCDNVMKKAFRIAVVCATLFVAMPSSKTIAMMYVIPAVANSETIQQEAADWYDIAKEGFREMVGVEAEELTKPN